MGWIGTISWFNYYFKISFFQTEIPEGRIQRQVTDLLKWSLTKLEEKINFNMKTRSKHI